jgi:DNA-binding LytR/AlgR family response regulator
MRVLLLEDEPPARDRLVQAVARVDPSCDVVAALATVDDALTWLAGNPAPELVLADVQLADGLSFEIFERHDAPIPVVFCTAFDQYVLDAMATNGIDYLLKPIRDDALARALDKYRRLQKHFEGTTAVRALAQTIGRPRRRVLAKSGSAMVPIGVDDIAYLVVRDKLATVVTNDGARHDIDSTLAELETELDPTRFFRLNRQVLASAGAITRVHPWTKGRLRVELAPPVGEDVIVSQPSAPRLREWLGG